MKLGSSNSSFSPNGDSSTKLENVVPVTISFINKDASDMLGQSGGCSSIARAQAIDIFNSSIVNVTLSQLADVSDTLGNAPSGSIFIKSGSSWTYGSAYSYTLLPATNSVLGGVIIGDGIDVDADGVISVTESSYTLPTASDTILGGIKVGSGLAIDGNSILSSNMPIATSSILGGVKIGENIIVDVDGKISVSFPSAYSLPIASSILLGGVKVGSGLQIDLEGVLSVVFPDGYVLPAATVSALGGVKIGQGLDVTEDGTISATFVAPLSNILSWDDTQYTAYANKKSVDPGYVYLYNDYEGDDLVPSYPNHLKLDGFLTGLTFTSIQDSRMSIMGDANIFFLNELNQTFSVALGGGTVGGERFALGYATLYAHDETADASIPIRIGDYILGDTGESIIIDPANNTFDINMSTVILSKGVPSKWLALDSNKNVVYMDAPAAAYTHPTQSALSPTLTGANVLASLVVDALGHVTTAVQRTLTLADLGFTGDADATKYTHPVSGIVVGEYNNITFDENGHAVAGEALPYGDVFGPALSIDNTVPRFDSITGKIIKSSGVSISDEDQISFVSGKLIPQTDAPLTPSGGEIYSSTNGNLYYYNSASSSWVIIADSTAPKVVPVTLPYASTVAGRCAAAVEGVDYPTGWTVVVSPSNPNDLLITHGLDRGIAMVTVFSINGAVRRQLFANVAYSGIELPTSDSLLIEGLSTVAYSIVINCIFA